MLIILLLYYYCESRSRTWISYEFSLFWFPPPSKASGIHLTEYCTTVHMKVEKGGKCVGSFKIGATVREISSKMPRLISFPSNGRNLTRPRMHWDRYPPRPLPDYSRWLGLHQWVQSPTLRSWKWKRISQKFSTAHNVFHLYIAAVSTCIVPGCTVKSRKRKAKAELPTSSSSSVTCETLPAAITLMDNELCCWLAPEHQCGTAPTATGRVLALKEEVGPNMQKKYSTPLTDWSNCVLMMRPRQQFQFYTGVWVPVQSSTKWWVWALRICGCP